MSIRDCKDCTYSSCGSCNGYYAQPSSASPICRVCHSFLYPLGVNCTMFIDNEPVAQKSDGEDSGTEEPQNFYETLRPPPNKKVSLQKTIDKDIPDDLNEAILTLSGARPSNILPEGRAERLPEDVLLMIFSYLDDVALWSVSQVCRRWGAILERQIGEAVWKKYTLGRWPFLPSRAPPKSWKHLYSMMIHSSSCFICLSQQRRRWAMSKAHYFSHQVPVKSANRPDSSFLYRNYRISQEMSLLSVDPPEGAFLKPVDNVNGEWFACILGPANSPYEGGHFYLTVSVPCRYPMRPPVVRFLTKIFHPNISQHGDIGLDSLQHNWTVVLTLSKVLLSIQSLLTDPYTKVCMEPEIGQMYRNDYALFEQTARLWTELYARHHLR